MSWHKDIHIDHHDASVLRASIANDYRWDDGFEDVTAPLFDAARFIDRSRIRRIASQARGRVVAVSFLTSEYMAVGLRWIEAIKRAGVADVAIVAGDVESASTLESLGVETIYARLTVKLSAEGYRSRDGFSRKGLAINVLKFPVVLALLEEGVDVVMSDIDAQWIQNPLSHLSAFDDVAFQRVLYHPKQIASRWSFAACSGFVSFKANDKVRALVEDCIREHQSVHCDQVALNLALLSGSTRWREPVTLISEVSQLVDARDESLFGRYASHVVSGECVRYRAVLTALPHSLYWRHEWAPAESTAILVYHPNAAKNAAAKLDRWRRFNREE